MARQRIIDERLLMKATEELLLEKGYDGFHFKLLSERLGVGRSTIYEYYANKDELIASYMEDLMTIIIDKCSELDIVHSPIQQLKGLLEIFITYSQIHQFIQYIPQLRRIETNEMKVHMEKLDQDHRKLFSLIVDIIKNAQKEKYVRCDLPPELITSIFFNSIQIPKSLETDQKDWTEKLFSIIYEGIEKR